MLRRRSIGVEQMRLHEQVAHLKAQLKYERETLQMIENYIRSPKFHQSNLCNVNDIHMRINERRFADSSEDI